MPYKVYSENHGILDYFAGLEDAISYSDAVQLLNVNSDRVFIIHGNHVVYRATSKESFEITG